VGTLHRRVFACICGRNSLLSWMQSTGNRIGRCVASHQGLPQACAADLNRALIDGGAARVTKEAVIVTHNIEDFLPEMLGRYGLAKGRPGAFCWGLLAGHEMQVLAGIRVHRANLRTTPMSPTDTSTISPKTGWACPGWLSHWYHSAAGLISFSPLVPLAGSRATGGTLIPIRRAICL
jgi:hypothetical protein